MMVPETGIKQTLIGAHLSLHARASESQLTAVTNLPLHPMPKYVHCCLHTKPPPMSTSCGTQPITLHMPCFYVLPSYHICMHGASTVTRRHGGMHGDSTVTRKHGGLQRHLAQCILIQRWMFVNKRTSTTLSPLKELPA